MALRTVGVRLTAEIADYQRKMRQAGKDARDFQGELATAAKGGHLDAVADQAAGAGLALTAVAGTAIKLSMDFEKAMSGVSAATHASAGEMETLRQAALEAGKDTQYSATEAAKGITELSKAGVATADILGGGLDGALDLAAAGQIEVADAAETAASAMVQFKLKGQDLPHVADLLAAAAGKAQGTVSDMSQALNQAGLVAAQTGLSIEETTGGLAAFASAGLTGSDAGTSFKQMLLMLQAPSDVTRGMMEELGISAYDASGQFVGLAALAQQLRDKLGHLTPELRANALAQIFGADAVRGASILYEQGAVGIQDWINKVDDAGYASETAAKLTDNLAGDLERLRGEIETLAIEAGGGANSGLRVLAQGAEALVSQFGQLPGVVSGGATVLAALGGTLLLGAAGWVKMRRANADALEELRATGPGGERAAKGLEATSKWAGRAAAAFAATQIAAAGVSAAFGDNLNPQTEALADSLAKWANTGERAGEATRLLGDEFEHLGYDLGTLDQTTWAGIERGIAGTIEGFTGLGSVMDESLEHAKERVSALDAALAQMVSSGNPNQARAVFEKLAAEAAKSGVTVKELTAGLPQYSAAVQTAGKESSKTAGQVGEVGEAAEGTAEQVEKLNQEFADLFDAQMSADRAALKLEESVVGLEKELRAGARTLSLNSEEGRKNRAAVLDQLEAIEDLRQARLDEGEALDVTNRKYAADVKALKESMRQAGFTEKAINDLIGEYEDIPRRVATDIQTPGLPVARKGIEDYDKKLDDLARRIRTEVTVVGKEKAQKELETLLIAQQAAKKGITISEARHAFRKNAGNGYHDGGWTGAGGEWDEAGIVHADEYVIKKASRQRIEQKHPGLLDEMNATGQLPGYQVGGMVMPFKVNAAVTQIMSMAEALSKVTPDFGNWPSSPGAQRGDSGVWRGIVQMIKATGPLSGSFGNGYRPGDPKWHGSGRAVDWMGYNQDELARFLAAKRPLELIHRTRSRDYAYTRGVNKGSFNSALMEAHRNHIHIAMADGGVIREPVMGVGASGATYSFGENWQPERVTPMAGGSGGMGGVTNVTVNVSAPVGSHPREIGRTVVAAIGDYLQGGGELRINGEKVF